MADEYISRPEFTELDHRLSKEIKTNREGIEQHSKEIARLEAISKSLESLPMALTNLEKTMVVISSSMEGMDRNMEDVKRSVSEQERAIKDLRAENTRQNESLEKIDNKSKVDILLFAKENFWKIFSIIAIGYVVVDLIMRKMGG